MKQTSEAQNPALTDLARQIIGFHGDAINCILYYGSCLRSNDPFTGIVDLYLIVDHYADFYHNPFKSILNWLLPPDVFYKEFDIDQRRVRVKYNVLSSRDLHRGLSKRWWHSYLWGRFCQPVALLWRRNADIESAVNQSLDQAAVTFLDRILPLAEPQGNVRDLWIAGLKLSYAAEIRSERANRASELVDYSPDYYLGTTMTAIPKLRLPLILDGDLIHYRITVSRQSKLGSQLAWASRRFQGKVLSVLRLIKALFSFEGGLEYAAWKLSRHSGQTIEIPDKVKRHPLIFVWPLIWKLYRQGIIK